MTDEKDSASADSLKDCRYLVISDLHLGSRYCLRDVLREFLERLPDKTALVLNGDVVDKTRGRLSPADDALMRRVCAESMRREVVWIYGNHDAGFKPDTPSHIRFVDELVIDHHIYLAHGHGFDRVMPAHRWFVRTFRAMHHLRVALGADAVHVAAYAKRWARLYRVLRRHVLNNAVRHAQWRGCDVVACGHTHAPGREAVNGIAYFNTGSWTELPVYGLCVGEAECRMLQLAG